MTVDQVQIHIYTDTTIIIIIIIIINILRKLMYINTYIRREREGWWCLEDYYNIESINYCIYICVHYLVIIYRGTSVWYMIYVTVLG